MMGRLAKTLIYGASGLFCFFFAAYVFGISLCCRCALVGAGLALGVAATYHLVQGMYDQFEKQKVYETVKQTTGTAWPRLKVLSLGVAAAYRLVQDMSKPSEIWKMLRGEDQATWNALQASGKE